jgi:hypothetical protein
MTAQIITTMIPSPSLKTTNIELVYPRNIEEALKFDLEMVIHFGKWQLKKR